MCQVQLSLLRAANLFAADSLQAIFDRAVSALVSQDYTAAERSFQAVLRAKPNHVGNLGVVGCRTTSSSKPLRLTEDVRAQLASPGIKRVSLELVDRKEGRRADALPVFAQALAENSAHRQFPEPLGVGHSEEALAGLRNLRAARPARTPSESRGSCGFADCARFRELGGLETLNAYIGIFENHYGRLPSSGGFFYQRENGRWVSYELCCWFSEPERYGGGFSCSGEQRFLTGS